MNILMLFSTDIPPCEGIASHIIGLAGRLRDRGHNITLMTRGGWQRKVEFEYDGFRVIKVPFYPLYPFHIYCQACFVRRIIRSLAPKPDLIHLHSPLVPAIPKDYPIVSTFHTPMLVDASYIEGFGLRALLIKAMAKTTSYWVERKVLKTSDAVITVSQGVADDLRDFYGYRGSLHTVPNAVDTDFYKSSSLNVGQRKLLYVGRLSYRKGLFEIVDSARDVVKRYPRVKYVLVGSGPLRGKIQKKVIDSGLEINFEFCGEIRDRQIIRKHYQDASIVLIPSYYEGLPMTLVESMACGKAIIATDTNFSKGILRNGVSAILIKPRSAKELADASIRLLSSQELRESLGREARKTAVEKMSLSLNVDKMEKIYANAIKKWQMEQKK